MIRFSLKRIYLKMSIICLEQREKILQGFKIMLIVVNLFIWTWAGLKLAFYFNHPAGEVQFNYSALYKLHQKRKPRDLIVLHKKIIKNADNSFDGYFEVKNPNQRWLVTEVVYNADLIQAGRVYARETKKTFFEPQQTKKLLALGLKSKNISQAEIGISFARIIWKKAVPFPQVSLEVVRKSLEFTRDKTIYQGVVRNQSKFSLKEVKVDVFLYQNNQIVKLNQTFIYNLKPREEREFLVFWLGQIQADQVQVFLDVNPFLDLELPAYPIKDQQKTSAD